MDQETKRFSVYAAASTLFVCLRNCTNDIRGMERKTEGKRR